MHANTQPVATNHIPGAARAAVLAAILILAAVAGILIGNAIQGTGSGNEGSLGAFSAANMGGTVVVQQAYEDYGLRHLAPPAEYVDFGLRLTRQAATTSPTWDSDHTAPALR